MNHDHGHPERRHGGWRRAFLFSTLALATAMLPGQALAVDGVIEINQARALAGGVTAGDSAGFPVTLSASGSYRLTGNLTVPSSTSGIVASSASPNVRSRSDQASPPPRASDPTSAPEVTRGSSRAISTMRSRTRSRSSTVNTARIVSAFSGGFRADTPPW